MGKDLNKCKVLVMGATFKEDVEDIRNSKVADVINEFKSYGVSAFKISTGLTKPTNSSPWTTGRQ